MCVANDDSIMIGSAVGCVYVVFYDTFRKKKLKL